MDRYTATVATYSEVVQGASGLTGVAFETARNHADEARTACRDAESALRKHEKEHGCLERQTF